MYSQPCEKVGSYIKRPARLPGDIDGLKNAAAREIGFISDVILYASAANTPPDIVPPEAEAAAVAVRTNSV